MPVVLPGAVDAYLGRRLDSWDFLKEVSTAELLAYTRQLGMRFASDCWQHQLACFAIGAQLPEFLFLLKMGGGKSKIILDLIRYRKRRGELGRALVLVPQLLHLSTWEDQIKTHAPDLRYRILDGSARSRTAALEKAADIYVMNFAGLAVFMTQVKFNPKLKKPKQIIVPGMAGDFASRFNFVAFDEIHKIVDFHSTYYQMFEWMSSACEYRYGLTGTPFGRDPTPLWGQFRLIDGGETLGPRIGMFRQTFFTPRKHYFKGIEWKFNPKMAPELHRVIKHRSISYVTTEYQDMPQRLRIRIPVRLWGEAAAYYQRIIDGIIEARGDYRSLGNIFTRMRQCASGFIAMRADDASRIEVRFKENPKLDMLHEFLKSRPDEKVLVFHEFIPSGRLIESMLDQAKIPYAAVRGETKNPAVEYSRFLEDKKRRVFVLNNQTGSEAINPQYVCRRAVFYESPVDPKQREQAEGRVWRPGQRWPVFIHDLTVLGTIEEKIILYLKEGRNLQKAVLGGDADALMTESNTTEVT